MIGFMPGFPYIGDLPPRLRLARRDEPRAAVPAGSIAVANDQTGIYPRRSPGGWHIVGRTEVALFDPRCEPPALLRAGDFVQFVPL
jgi:KipI family sensor histidine kinase inhibitor